MRVSIYALIDPRAPNVIRYVGQTAKPRERLRKHLRAAGRDKPTYRGHWIAKLREEGVEPVLIVMVRVDVRHRNEAERHMIRQLRLAGHPLVNGSAGGDGGALNPEIQARVNAKLRAGIRSGRYKGPMITPAQAAARNERLSRLRSDPRHNPMKRPEVRAKNAASQRARAAARGYVPKVTVKRGSPEYAAMMSVLVRARPKSVAEKISRSLTGRTKSPAHREALRQAALRRNGGRKP